MVLCFLGDLRGIRLEMPVKMLATEKVWNLTQIKRYLLYVFLLIRKQTGKKDVLHRNGKDDIYTNIPALNF